MKFATLFKYIFSHFKTHTVMGTLNLASDFSKKATDLLRNINNKAVCQTSIVSFVEACINASVAAEYAERSLHRNISEKQRQASYNRLAEANKRAEKYYLLAKQCLPND